MSVAILSSEPKSSSASGNLEADSLVSGLSFMLVANVLQRAIGFIRNLVLCRFLAEDQLGLWALSSSFFVLAAPLAVLGLPGTFGRFVASYRASGQLNLFLKRMTVCSSIGAMLAASALVCAPASTSSIIFGLELSHATMLLIALTLCLVILFNATTELLSGLCKPRIVSAMHTTNSLVFTITSLTGVSLVNDWRILVAAFGVGSLAGLIPALSFFRNWEQIEPSSQPPLAMRAMWKRVLPFAISIWCMNLLINLFDVVDRYMLLHLAAETAEQGRALVGQFHSGRIMPMLLSSLTLMLNGMLLPYLASEWEAGNKSRVADSQRLTLKCVSLFFMILSVGSLAIAPLLFDHVLHGKYSDGLSIMPQAMFHCCLTAMGFLLQNYFWCAERGKTVGVIIAIGLLVNILLNAWWVPSFGLRGAMTATSLSGAAILFMTIWEMRRCGVRLGWRCLCFTALPISLLFGSVLAAAVLATVLILIGRTDWLLNAKEKQSIEDAITPKLNKMGLPIHCLWASNRRPRQLTTDN
jgi:polysaccharide transporter, PST family